MSDKVNTLITRIKALEDELETAFEEKRDAMNLRIEHGRAAFDQEIKRQHAALRTSLVRYVTGSRPLVVLTAPVIYAVIIPFVLLDIFVTIYQTICFPIYGIRKARRKDHIVFDRHQLQYLNAVERLNCIYCAYGNGLLSYATEIAARTEQFWCPIKHARRLSGHHRYYAEFADYGDAEAYRKRIESNSAHRNNQD